MSDIGARKAAMAKGLAAIGQDHVLYWWPDLADAERRRLLAELEGIDLDAFRERIELLDAGHVGEKFSGHLEPLPYVRLPRNDEERARFHRAREHGKAHIGAGRVGVVTVAGGQGSRLGYEHPKGMFPLGPVTERSLFQIHAEKILARGRRCGHAIPWCIMTSEATHEETEDFLRERDFFGIDAGDVRFFQQQMIPAVDHRRRLILESKSSIFRNPNGHGGAILALYEDGILDWLEERGVVDIYYFQVDNVGLDVADPVFLGFHDLEDAEMSNKALIKQAPGEKLGLFGLVDGKVRVIEYSDFDPAKAAERDERGELVYRLGSPAVHVFDLEFVRRLNEGALHLPYHIAEKNIPYVNEAGEFVTPAEKNGLKFETFIFDALPLARKVLILEMDRGREWAPLKNAEGEDSPASVRRYLVDTYAGWLEQAGVDVPRRDGEPRIGIEISPLFALDGDELREKLNPGSVDVNEDVVIK